MLNLRQYLTKAITRPTHIETNIQKDTSTGSIKASKGNKDNIYIQYCKAYYASETHTEFNIEKQKGLCVGNTPNLIQGSKNKIKKSLYQGKLQRNCDNI